MVPGVKKVQRELFMHIGWQGEGFFFDKAKESEERGKIKLNLRILRMKEEDSNVFDKLLFNFEHSRNKGKLVHVRDFTKRKGCSLNPSLANLHSFRTGKGLHPTIQIFKLECYQNDSSYNLHKEFIQITPLK